MPKQTKPTHPMQPLVLEKGVVRFKRNKIVETLLDTGVLDMNKIAVMDFPKEDQIQFAQLIGYSVDGFGSLSYVDDATWERALKELRKFHRTAYSKRELEKRAIKG